MNDRTLIAAMLFACNRECYTAENAVAKADALLKELGHTSYLDVAVHAGNEALEKAAQMAAKRMGATALAEDIRALKTEVK